MWKRWPHVRAALVTIHLVAIVIAAIPAPVGGMSRRAWSDPTVQDEFRAWGARLGVEPKKLEDFMWDLGTRWMGLRRKVMRWVWPYLEVTGTDQPWRMFVAPHRHPSRFQVQVRTADADFETLFEERSSEYRWRETFFEQERLRSILFRYSWNEYSGDARRTCEWLAREIFVERPDAVEVRCRYWKARSPSPREAREGAEMEGRWTQVKQVRR